MSHTCACPGCTTFDLPTTQQGPGHVGLRFGDVTYIAGKAYSVRSVKPFLNGVYQHHCIEALPGVEGFVVVYSVVDQFGGVHRCRHSVNCPYPCQEIIKGRVRVQIGSYVFE